MTESNVTPIRGGQTFSLTPQNLDEAMKYADIIAKSKVIPKDYQGNPGDVLVAMQWGLELGLPPLQALQNIAVINGRPAVWGDAMLAIVRSHPSCEYVSEEFDDSRWVATCRAKRRGEQEQIRQFSHDDAQRAGLAGKQGPWQSYPKRMIQMRARAFALRDVFPDALRGIAVAEEVRDIPEKDVTPEPAPAASEPEQLPPYPDDRFAENLPKWRQAIQGGRISAEEVIAKASSSYQMTDEQAEQIRQCQPIEGGE
ncbi:recombinase RecT [Halorhodospira halophila]|uniref:recombinase RecT n=1 Tax=Halorhodospira halophila TaxID=1053 RepID=UPI0019123FD2|nr:recombinase RecT [Halorhodospira halophila]MBK5942747.1 hypothetical protein [Halorhodospira halophila]